jgi:hypothetical protein
MQGWNIEHHPVHKLDVRKSGVSLLRFYMHSSIRGHSIFETRLVQNSFFQRSPSPLPYQAAMEPDMEPYVAATLFKDGMGRNAARVPKEKWEEYKEQLCSLYREKTIDEILGFMRTEHGFVAKWVLFLHPCDRLQNSNTGSLQCRSAGSQAERMGRVQVR